MNCDRRHHQSPPPPPPSPGLAAVCCKCFVRLQCSGEDDSSLCSKEGGQGLSRGLQQKARRPIRCPSRAGTRSQQRRAVRKAQQLQFVPSCKKGRQLCSLHSTAPQQQRGRAAPAAASPPGALASCQLAAASHPSIRECTRIHAHACRRGAAAQRSPSSGRAGTWRSSNAAAMLQRKQARQRAPHHHHCHTATAGVRGHPVVCLSVQT